MFNAKYKKTNHYRARYQQVEKFIGGVPDNLSIGCFGSSYARYDIDFDNCLIRGFNFGVYPQTLHYDYVLLKHYIEHFKKGAYVIIVLPELVFAWDTYEKESLHYRYYKFLRKDEILNYSWKTKFFEIDYPLLKYPGKIKKIWNDDACIYDKIFETTDKCLEPENQGKRFAQERVAGWCGQFGLKDLKSVDNLERFDEVFKKNRNRVKGMIELCHKHQLKPVLLVPPVSKALKEFFGNEFLEYFLYKNIKEILAEYKNSNVKLLDYYNDVQFENFELYSNSDFMNRKGRAIFTEQMLKDLFSSNISFLSKSRCTGCSACRQICPKEAIVMKEDKEGFWYPAIDSAKCVACGKCIGVCPVINAIPKNSDMEETAYAAWSLQPEIREHSTSGGVFSELALKMLQQDAKIYGAIYNSNFEVEHIGIDCKQDLHKLRQSKYVQSDLKNIFLEIEEDLKSDRRVLFCGAPCQCEALLHFLWEKKINCERLLLVDFICRGSNSPKVYRLFLEELKKEYQSPIKCVWFKNKTYGWNDFSTKVEFQNGKQYLKTRYEDEYIRGYIEKNLYIRPSCMQCEFKGIQRVADITLADFWGVSLGDKQNDTDRGTSLVIIHTSKGKKLFESISGNIFFEEKQVKDAISANPCIIKSAQEGEHRKQFMHDLDTMGFFANIRRFL